MSTSLISYLQPIIPQLPAMFNGLFGNVLNSNVPTSSQLPSGFLPAQQQQQPIYNNGWFNPSYGNVMNSVPFNVGGNMLPYMSSYATQGMTALDTALSHYRSARSAASTATATLLSVATAGLAGMTAEDKKVAAEAMQSGLLGSNSLLTQLFEDSKLAGVDLVSLLNTSQSGIVTQLTAIDEEIKKANEAVAAANTAVGSAPSLDAWRTAVGTLNAAQARVAQLTRERADLQLSAYQPSYTQSSIPFGYNQMPYGFSQQSPFGMNFNYQQPRY